MAVEFVGGSLLSAFIQVTFEKLASTKIGDYFRERKLNDKLLKRLNITLLSINTVVDDAEKKQIRNRHLKTWLDAVIDVIFEAEDLLEEIDIEVSRCNGKLNLNPVFPLARYGVSLMSLLAHLTKKLNQRCIKSLTT